MGSESEIIKSNIMDKIINELKNHYKKKIDVLRSNLDEKINNINGSKEKNKKELMSRLVYKHTYNDIPLLEHFYISELDIIQKLLINTNEKIDQLKEKIINEMTKNYVIKSEILKENLERKIKDIQSSNEKNKREQINKMINKYNNNDVPLLKHFHISEINLIKNYTPLLNSNNDLNKKQMNKQNVPKVQNVSKVQNVPEINFNENPMNIKKIQNIPEIGNKINKTSIETIAGTQLEKFKTDTVTNTETIITTTSKKSIIETITKTITTINFVEENEIV